MTAEAALHQFKFYRDDKRARSCSGKTMASLPLQPLPGLSLGKARRTALGLPVAPSRSQGYRAGVSCMREQPALVMRDVFGRRQSVKPRPAEQTCGEAVGPGAVVRQASRNCARPGGSW